MYYFHFMLHVHFNDGDDNIDSLMRSHSVSYNNDTDGNSFAEVGETLDGEFLYSANIAVHSPGFVPHSNGTYLRAFIADEELFKFVAANFPNVIVDEQCSCIDFWLECWEFTIRNSKGQIVCSNDCDD